MRGPRSHKDVVTARSKNGEAISVRGRSPAARKELQQFIGERSKAGDLDEWRRGKAILSYIEGRRVVELAGELEVTRGSINRWLQWYEALGYLTDVGDLIEQRFGVRYHKHNVPRLLHELGISLQFRVLRPAAPTPGWSGSSIPLIPLQRDAG